LGIVHGMERGKSLVTTTITSYPSYSPTFYHRLVSSLAAA
jgi:hypothetical protein